MKLFSRIIVTILFLVSAFSVSAQYTDLPANIIWNGPDIWGGITTVDEVESAYNNARIQENTALSTSLPSINFPENSVWQTMSVNQKALWIVNIERVDRGLVPFEATANEVIQVAQDYSQYLMDNDTTGHIADGHNTLYRLQQNSTINSCLQAYAENIAYNYSSGVNPPTYAIERMIYLLIYEDAPSSWGHRRNFFISSFNDNSGVVGAEGILGVGYVVGSNYRTWQTGAVAVFDIIDPCSSWVYPSVSISKIDDEILMYILQKPAILQIETNATIQSIVISDIHGRICKKIQDDIHELFLTDLPKGIYIVKVSTSTNKCITKQIVIE